MSRFLCLTFLAAISFSASSAVVTCEQLNELYMGISAELQTLPNIKDIYTEANNSARAEINSPEFTEMDDEEKQSVRGYSADLVQARKETQHHINANTVIKAHLERIMDLATCEYQRQ